jgi:hypothetical protein
LDKVDRLTDIKAAFVGVTACRARTAPLSN